ncbi:MAG: HupE / UreJ protein [Pseudopedobacter saltans]|uniref:HupE / UreJ protein n=1 Tax=Pseudopedobacter saltans TaxID=151895 RepID=A0A2W5H9S3_9SPHI|nr:MAG: HupE / UreJ protein [Pseudopedobacter saltans]
MNDFWLFFTTGIEHIADWKGIDHILFISALCLRYVWSDWRKILILITAFTIGHSLTLALSVFNIINIPTVWTEFLIAVTILITALSDLKKESNTSKKYSLIYYFALVFGFIHGMGFSTLLKSMLGRDRQIVGQLFAFNLGLEVGQILIVICLLSILTLFAKLGINRLHSRIFISGAIAALALEMCLERWPFRLEENKRETRIETKYTKDTHENFFSKSIA